MVNVDCHGVGLKANVNWICWDCHQHHHILNDYYCVVKLRRCCVWYNQFHIYLSLDLLLCLWPTTFGGCPYAQTGLIYNGYEFIQLFTLNIIHLCWGHLVTLITQLINFGYRSMSLYYALR